MQKINRTVVDRHAGSQHRKGRWTMLLMIGLLLAPLVVDVAKLSYAQWSTLFGPKPVVSTPAFHLIEQSVDRASKEFRKLTKRPFRTLPWRVEWAVGGLAFSLIAGSLILRYGRTR